MDSKWKDTSWLHKTIKIVSIAIGLAVIVLALLQLFGVWEQAINVYIPLTGISMLCQAYLQWNVSRKVAYFDIFTAVFIFFCSVVVFFVK